MMSSGLSQLWLVDNKCITESLCFKVGQLSLKDVGIYQAVVVKWNYTICIVGNVGSNIWPILEDISAFVASIFTICKDLCLTGLPTIQQVEYPFNLNLERICSLVSKIHHTEKQLFDLNHIVLGR